MRSFDRHRVGCRAELRSLRPRVLKDGRCVNRRKVCVVAGVGPGNGAALTRLFAAGGYQVAMLARSAERLSELEREVLRRARLHGRHLRSRRRRVDLRRHQAGAGSGRRPGAQRRRGRARRVPRPSRPRRWSERSRSTCCRCCTAVSSRRATCSSAAAAAIVVTGNTAARRGMPAFAGFAPTKAAQRILARVDGAQPGPARHSRVLRDHRRRDRSAVDAQADAERARRLLRQAGRDRRDGVAPGAPGAVGVELRGGSAAVR